VYTKICSRRDFRFPFPESGEGDAPHQLAPNAWRTFFACVILWPRVLGEGHELSVREFLKIYKPTRNPKSEYTFNFQGRQKTKFILLSGYSSNKHWKEKFFFAQGDWEFLSTEVTANPRVPREVRRLLTSGQDEPVLNKNEGAYVRELMEYAEGHVMEMEFNAIFSQSALATRLKYPPVESAVVKEVLTEPKLKKKRKAMTLQISESQSPRVAKRKSLVLSSNKSSSGVEVEKLPEFLQEEIPKPSTESAAPSPKKQKQTTKVPQGKASGPLERISTETPQGEAFGPLELITTQPSSANQFLVTEATAPASPKKHKQTVEVPSTEVSKPSEYIIIQTFPTKQVDRPRWTREEKGKDKVGDDVPPILAVASLSTISEAPKESAESPLSGVVASGNEFEMMGTLLGEGIEAEPIGTTTESYLMTCLKL
jgi:hypothetical protein